MMVSHRARTKGVSKYNWIKVFKGFLDMVIIWFWRKYEDRPMHFFGGMGLVLVTVSSILLIVLAISRLFFEYYLSDKIWPLVALGGFVTGVQFLVLGILADLVSKKEERKAEIRSVEIY